ncbi:MAG: hypothetical protein JSV22_10010 [Bacteroidales bacterium]|nr:MAG: hypothetical protein JSV22_10010 [Bacteroidales bacterium]
MKASIKYMFLLMIPVIFIGMILISCEKKDGGGTPVIHYIRITDPEKADSLLTAAFMGDLIVIVGENLGGAREIWFNDQEAYLTPTYITDETILVNVPSNTPKVITNQIKIIFADGYELLHDFTIDIPGPELYSIKCEYVADGGTVELTGDYFFDPTTVIFPGNLEAEISTRTKTELEVIVPDGATTGKIKIRTTFGEVESDFLFRDNRNIILDFDTYFHELWTAPVIYADSAPDPAPCSGNYVNIISDEVGSWDWENYLSIQYWAENSAKGDVPLATGLVNDLIFKFEANVPIEWHDVRMEIYMTIYGNGHGRDAQPPPSHARWMPWIDEPYITDGWITVSIPLSDFMFDKNDPEDNEQGSRPIEDLSVLTNLTMMVFGPTSSSPFHPVKICIDNVRIVPSTVD